MASGTALGHLGERSWVTSDLWSLNAGHPASGASGEAWSQDPGWQSQARSGQPPRSPLEHTAVRNGQLEAWLKRTAWPQPYLVGLWVL